MKDYKDQDKNGWNSKLSGWQKINKNIDSDLLNTKVLNSKQINNLSQLELKIDYSKAIIVLAGGIDSQGVCHKFVQDRLDLAYQQFINNPSIIICCGGGSYHTKTITNQSGYVIHESTSCSQYLINKGIPGKYIYKEWSSYDTIANGYFAFTNFIIPLRITEITLITSNFHMERSQLIFTWMNHIFNSNIKLNFLESSNDQINPQVLEARIIREQNSCHNITNVLIKEYNTLPKFHCWFYTQHKAYCSTYQDDITDILDDKCLRSY